jgi:thiol:disulfide interchange protein
LLSVFWLLAAVAVGLNYGWGGLFQQSGFNVFISAFVFAMALAFLGVWEFPIPGFIGSGSAGTLAEKEGAVGAFSKGVVTTLLATPCTGPFMGGALAWALQQPPATVFAVFTSVGLGMASPYIIVGAMPELVRFLPKPGAWMDTFKQVMGFVLLGTIVYIFTFMATSYVVPTIALLFAVWAACWWLGRTPLTAETVQKTRAWLVAAALVGVAWVLIFPGVNSLMPRGFALPVSSLHAIMEARLHPEEDLWQPFKDRADLERRIGEGNTVVIDFTADWCATCKTLEAFVLDTDEVRTALGRHKVVPLKADWTDRDPKVTEMMELLRVRQVPVLAIFPAGQPNRPIVFLNGYTKAMVLDALDKASR